MMNTMIHKFGQTRSFDKNAKFVSYMDELLFMSVKYDNLCLAKMALDNGACQVAEAEEEARNFDSIVLANFLESY